MPERNNREAPPESVWAILAAAVWKFRRRTMAALGLVILAKLATVSVPLILKRIIDALSRPETVITLPIMLLLGYALMRFLGTFFGEVRDVVFAQVTQRTVSDFLTRIFRHLHALSPRFHTVRQTGALTRDVERGTAGIGFLLGVALFTLVPTLVEIATVVAILASGYSLVFTAILLSAFIAYGGFTLIFTDRRTIHQRKLNALDSTANNRLVDSLLNYEAVKYYTGEAIENRRFKGIMNQWIVAGIRNQKALTQLHVGQSGIIALAVAAVMLVAAGQVVDRVMTVGDLVLINAFVIQICLPLNSLGFIFREAKDASIKAERLFRLLAEKPEIADADNAAALSVTAGEVRFDNVSFGYSPSQLALHDISFTIAPGSTTAVVGGSGSGKSTLVRLLLRFYDVGGGAIYIDGQDIRQTTQTSLRAAIGVVPQDMTLFNDTIGYNIRYARPDASHDEVIDAARVAEILDFIEQLPHGIETVVGERGMRLSGGERQRIAIARAVLKNAPILVFDEATSALDTRAERLIHQQFERLARGRTALIIAHRLSTVVDADEILVLDRGHIVERGTHERLVQKNGMYAQMWQLQQREREMDRLGRRLSMQTVNLAGLVADVIDGLRLDMDQRRINLYSIFDHEPVRVTGEPGQLHKAIWDMLERATFDSPDGGRIEVRVVRTDALATLTIIDSVPRASDDAAGIFAAQPDIETAVQDHRGVLKVQSGPRGSSVTMQLPLRAIATEGRQSGESIIDQPPAQVLDPHALEDVFVLLIDGNGEARELLGAVLKLHGARVHAVSSGAAALEWLDGMPSPLWPQVLLCDIALADEDGHAVIRQIRTLESRRKAELRDRMPAIAVTGLSGPADRMRILLSGFQLHLVKPVDQAELVAAVTSVVRRYPPADTESNVTPM